MFELVFGLIWTIFSTICFLPIFFTGMGFNLFIFIFMAIFEGIGIYMINRGAKKIITDKKTNEFGINTFGKIIGIYPTGSSVNGIPEMKADFSVYDPNIADVRVLSEVIGFINAIAKYQVGTFVNVLIYEDDINIVDVADPMCIPDSIKEKLGCNDETSGDNEIYLNGVKYVKADDGSNNYYSGR